MKILHITTVHREDDSRIYQKELKSLALRYETALIAQRKSNHIFDDITYFPLSSPHSRIDRLRLQKEAFLLANLYNPSIIHFHDPELILLAILFKFKGKKIVWDMHEDLSRQIMAKDWIPVLFRKPLSIFINVVERIILPIFDSLITVSSIYTDKYKWHKNVVEVKNLAKVEEFLGRPEKIKSNFSENTLVYVGGISKERGLVEMLSVTKKLHKTHNIKLKIAGPPLSKEQAKLISETDGAEYVGWLGRDDLSNLLMSSDIGLLTLHPTPNHKSTLAIKMFEYMAAGIPQITSNFPLWEGFIEDSHSGITVDPLSTKEIEDAIVYLLNNREILENMGKNGRNAVINKYNWEIESKKLIELYENLENE